MTKTYVTKTPYMVSYVPKQSNIGTITGIPDAQSSFGNVLVTLPFGYVFSDNQQETKSLSPGPNGFIAVSIFNNNLSYTVRIPDVGRSGTYTQVNNNDQTTTTGNYQFS